MASFPTPPNERARLRAVARLGARDEATSSFIDSLTSAAAAIAGTPMSAVTIVGADLVELRASRGLGMGCSARGDSICSHTIVGDRPLFVPDTRHDERFSANPYVLGPPYIRFYAGFLLRVEDVVVGALCVVDDRPRTLSDEQIARLDVLAAGAAAWLSLASTPADTECAG